MDNPSVARARTGAIPLLDAVRGLAALYVLAYHAVYWLDPAGSRLVQRHGAVRLLQDGNPLGLLGFGHHAVVVFFVLSGFVIHLRQAQRPGERASLGPRRWLTGYAARRGVRIYAPLLFALLLTAAVGAFGGRWFDDYFGHLVADRADARIVLNDNLGPEVALGVIVPASRIYGSNEPLWSVQYEVVYYAAYAVLLLLIVDRWRVPLAKTAGVVLVAAAVGWAALVAGAVPESFAGLVLAYPVLVAVYFPIWLGGALLAEAYARGVVVGFRRALAVGGLVAVAAGAGLTAPGHATIVPTDYLFAAGALLLGIAALLGREPMRAGRWTLLLAPTAHWSYSLYLVHFPVLMLFRGWWFGGDPVGDGHAATVVGFAVGLAAGFGAWWLVERPSLRLIRAMSGRPAAPDDRLRSAALAQPRA